MFLPIPDPFSPRAGVAEIELPVSVGTDETALAALEAQGHAMKVKVASR